MNSQKNKNPKYEIFVVKYWGGDEFFPPYLETIRRDIWPELVNAYEIASSYTPYEVNQLVKDISSYEPAPNGVDGLRIQKHKKKTELIYWVQTKSRAQKNTITGAIAISRNPVNALNQLKYLGVNPMQCNAGDRLTRAARRLWASLTFDEAGVYS